MKRFSIGIVAGLIVAVSSAPLKLSAAPAVTASDVPPVSVAGAPRSMVSFVVALPVQLYNAGDVRFRVERSGLVELLGRLEGVLGGRTDGTGRRQFQLTLRVPADAMVGLLDVGDVIFETTDGRIVTMPLVLRVPAVRAFRVLAPAPVTELRAGDRVELAFRVENTGNTTEQVALVVAPPDGWTLRTSVVTAVAVAPFAAREVLVRLTVPAGAQGPHRVTARLRETASRDSVVIASADAILSLADVGPAIEGFQVTPFLAMSGSQLGTAVAFGAGISGPISDGVRFTLRVTPEATGNLAGAGLTQFNAFGPLFQGSVQARGWGAEFGLVSAQLPDNAGRVASGEGVTGRLQVGARSIDVLAVRAPRGGIVETQAVAVRATQPFGSGSATVALSSLQQETQGVPTRELRAATFDLAQQAFGDWGVSGGVALRQFLGRTGIGFGAGLARRTDVDDFDARILHSPGGVAAFGLARDQVNVNWRRALTNRWSVLATASGSRDAGFSNTAVTTYGVSIGQQLAVGEFSTGSLRVDRNDFSVGTLGVEFGGFGSSAQGAEIGFASRTLGISWASTARAEVLGRTTELLGGRLLESRALQQSISANANRAFDRLGTFSLGGTAARLTPGLGFAGVSTSVYGAISSSPVSIGASKLSLELRTSVAKAIALESRVSSSLGATVLLPSNVEVRFTVERNPFITLGGRGGAWSGALRISSTTSVARPNVFMKTGGVVFNDLDGDGERDRGEPGVPDVVIAVDNHRFRTDQEGVYRLPPNVRGRVRVESAELPIGFIVSPAASGRLPERGDIPLRQTGSMAVRLQLSPNADGVIPQADVSKVSVWLIDASGFEWAGEQVEPGLVRFPNIPVGRYTFAYDFTRAGEPIRAEDGLLAEVASMTERTVTLLLRGRGVRIIAPPGGGRGGRGGGGTGSGRGGLGTLRAGTGG